MFIHLLNVARCAACDREIVRPLIVCVNKVDCSVVCMIWFSLSPLNESTLTHRRSSHHNSQLYTFVTECYASINWIPSNVLFLHSKSLPVWSCDDSVIIPTQKQSSLFSRCALHNRTLSIVLSERRYAPGPPAQSHIKQIIWIACNCKLQLQHASSPLAHSILWQIFIRKNRIRFSERMRNENE